MIGDFFPYNDKFLMTYWTGYFATRPAIKKRVREIEALVRSADVALASLVVSRPTAPYEELVNEAVATLEKAKRSFSLPSPSPRARGISFQ